MLAPSNGIEIDDICSVCLGVFTEEDACVTQCHHKFCKRCLDAWFNSNHVTCPLCRSDIQYFRHQGVDKRIVCIYKRRPPPALQGPPERLFQMSKRTYILLNMISAFSFSAFSICAMFWFQCERSVYAHQDEVNTPPP